MNLGDVFEHRLVLPNHDVAWVAKKSARDDAFVAVVNVQTAALVSSFAANSAAIFLLFHEREPLFVSTVLFPKMLFPTVETVSFNIVSSPLPCDFDSAVSGFPVIVLRLGAGALFAPRIESITSLSVSVKLRTGKGAVAKRARLPRSGCLGLLCVFHPVIISGKSIKVPKY